jgi:hypothetical protein
MKALSKNIKDEGNRFIDDIQVIRQDMYDKREQVSNFFFFLSSLFRKKSKEKKTKTKL